MEFATVVELGILVITSFGILSNTRASSDTAERMLQEFYRLQKELESLKHAVMDLRPSRGE